MMPRPRPRPLLMGLASRNPTFETQVVECEFDDWRDMVLMLDARFEALSDTVDKWDLFVRLETDASNPVDRADEDPRKRRKKRAADRKSRKRVGTSGCPRADFEIV